jgi:uncharacterized protein (TIGR00369 family)
MNLLEQIEASSARLLPGHLGIKVTEATPDQVSGELVVEEYLCTSGGILHGGTIMAFADTLGAIGAFLNLPPDTLTSTVESKTNFLRGVKQGDTIKGSSKLVNKGRTLMLWQTEIHRSDNKLAAVISQSQIIKSIEGK